MGSAWSFCGDWLHRNGKSASPSQPPVIVPVIICKIHVFSYLLTLWNTSENWKDIRNMHHGTLNPLLKIYENLIFLFNRCEIVLSLKWSSFYITAYPWPFQYWPLLVRTGPSTHEPVYRTCCMAHNSFVSSVGHIEKAHHTSYPCPPANESESLLINQLLFIDIVPGICNAAGENLFSS